MAELYANKMERSAYPRSLQSRGWSACREDGDRRVLYWVQKAIQNHRSFTKVFTSEKIVFSTSSTMLVIMIIINHKILRANIYRQKKEITRVTITDFPGARLCERCINILGKALA